MFINPLEILDLQPAPTAEIDHSMLKKAKRRLFAEIELSDHGAFKYKETKLSRSDCEEAINTLEKTEWVEFYSYLTTDPLLNDFLVNGNEDLFSSFKYEAIYQLPGFRRFISPHFAASFDKSLFKAFKENDAEKLKAIVGTRILIEPEHFYIAHRSLNREILERVEQIETITEKLPQSQTFYDDSDDLAARVAQLLQPALLNLLPIDFQAAVDKAASSVNALAITWHEIHSHLMGLASSPEMSIPDLAAKAKHYKVSRELLELVLQLELVDGGTQLLFRSNLDILEQNAKQVQQEVCYFCKCNTPDERHHIEKTLYKQTAPENGQNTYITSNLVVNQCENCSKIHLKAKRMFKRIFYTFTAIGAISGILLFSKPGDAKGIELYFPMFMIAFIFFLSGYLIANGVRNKFMDRQKMPGSKVILETHLLLKKKAKDGWTLTKPDKHGKLPESGGPEWLSLYD